MGKVAVVLCGAGYLDGSEIHESVLCMYHLEKAGHTLKCFAPNKIQPVVMDHVLNQSVKEESRNAIVESARIARGKVEDLESLTYEKFDALIIPGGFGAALCLSDFASQKDLCSVDPILEKNILEFYQAKRPIAATCISPVILASVFKKIRAKVAMTLGSDPANKEILDKMGMDGKICRVDEHVSDSMHRVYTTPCYMEPDDLVGVSDGIESMLKDFL